MIVLNRNRRLFNPLATRLAGYKERRGRRRKKGRKGGEDGRSFLVLCFSSEEKRSRGREEESGKYEKQRERETIFGYLFIYYMIA